MSFVPGGAVVREAVLAQYMVQACGRQADAIVAAVLLRLAWLAAELVAAGVLCGIKNENNRDWEPKGRSHTAQLRRFHI